MKINEMKLLCTVGVDRAKEIIEKKPHPDCTHYSEGNYYKEESKGKLRNWENGKPCISDHKEWQCDYWGCGNVGWARYTNGRAEDYISLKLLGDLIDMMENNHEKTKEGDTS